MGAIAAEFQWELSFLEQKQQACLFLFFVGDIAKKHMMSARRVPRACLLCKAFRSSYIELFYVSVHWDQWKLKWECWSGKIQYLYFKIHHRQGSSYPPLLSRIYALYPVLGRKLWRSLRHIEFLKYIGGSNFLSQRDLVLCFVTTVLLE